MSLLLIAMLVSAQTSREVKTKASSSSSQSSLKKWASQIDKKTPEKSRAKETSANLQATEKNLLIAALVRVGPEVLTTRDLQIHQFINEWDPLLNNFVEKKNPLQLLIWETMISLENKNNFNQTVSESEIKRAQQEFESKYEKDDLWRAIHVSKKELAQALERHFLAKKILSLKLSTEAMISISDEDVESYYAQNRNQLGQRPLDEVKDKIKVGLRSIKSKERFNDWMASLGRSFPTQSFSGVQVQ